VNNTRNKHKKTASSQQQIDFDKPNVQVHVHLHLDELLMAPTSKLDMWVPPVVSRLTPEAFQHVAEPKIEPAAKKKHKRSKTPETLRESVVKHVKILAYQSGKDVRTVWTDAYRELRYFTGIDAIWLSSITKHKTHLDVVESAGQLEDLLQVINALRCSSTYTPSIV
jgi:hypothetical protein